MFTETNFDVTFPFSDKYNCNKIERCLPLAEVIFLLFLYLYLFVITPLLIEINDLKKLSVKKCVKTIYLY